ncbi:MAG TPA: hypothetical protein PLB21_05400 [Actinomycetota bacterium]|nr:hypothetical protein [Actinomycetota bacterium]
MTGDGVPSARSASGKRTFVAFDRSPAIVVTAKPKHDMLLHVFDCTWTA